MLKRVTGLLVGAAMALTIPLSADAFAKTYYWISHGGPADPVWTYFLQGANQWAEDTGNTVNTSFHSGDVPSQQEAVRAAIAAGADAIVTAGGGWLYILRYITDWYPDRLILHPYMFNHMRKYELFDLNGVGQLAFAAAVMKAQQV